MTGYQSKKVMSQDKLNDDDDTQVYGDALTIAYQSGYYDGKKAAPVQEPVSDSLIRQYITALVANKPDEAANATKAMVDYVYTTPPAAQPAQEPVEDVVEYRGDGTRIVRIAPQRPWVGLTEKQIEVIEEIALTKQWAIRMTIAQLKECNA